MPAAVGVFTGLACGALLTVMGLAVWAGLRRTPDLLRAVQAVNWLAGAFLLIGALLAWWHDPTLSVPASRLALMAALAAPLGTLRSYSSWESVARALPALILAGILLWGPPGLASAEGGSLVSLALAICGGLGARAMGEALGLSPHVEWPSFATYVLLTSLVGGVALVNLWQRGTGWGGLVGEGGLVGAWLAWGAVWLVARRSPRLRAVLTVVAASSLIVTVVT